MLFQWTEIDEIELDKKVKSDPASGEQMINEGAVNGDVEDDQEDGESEKEDEEEIYSRFVCVELCFKGAACDWST